MMLLGLVSVPAWVVILLILLVTYYVFSSRNYDTFERMGIKWVKPWPFIGSMGSELFCEVHTNDVLMDKKLGSVYGYFEGRTPTLRVSDPDFIRELTVKEFNSFADHRTFDLGYMDPILNMFLTTIKGETWKMTRNVMTPTFTSGKLKQMAPLMAKCGSELNRILAEKVDKGESVPMKATYQAYLMDVIASCTFGVEINSQTNKDDKFMVNAKKMMFDNIPFWKFIFFFATPEFLWKRLPVEFINLEALRFFKQVVSQVIQQRQTSTKRRNDFLQLMLDAVKEAEATDVSGGGGDAGDSQSDSVEKTTEYRHAVKKVLTTDGVVAQSVLFLIAGFETVSVCLTYVSYLLAIHPECQEKLLKEVDDVLAANDGQVNYEAISQMHYMDMIISEALRVYPPAMRLDRICTHDCTVRGVPIPKDMPIAINVYAVHHNEAYHDNPFEFIPERFSPENKEIRNNFTYLPFGSGPRNCIGMRFALMEVKSCLLHILRDFRFVPAPDTQIPLKFRKRMPVLIPEKPITLKLEKRRV